MLSYLPSHTTFIHLWFFSLVLQTGHTLSNLGTGTHLAMALNQIMQLVLHHQTIIHNPLISHTHTIPAIKLLITVIHIDTKVSSVFISPTVELIAWAQGHRPHSTTPIPPPQLEAQTSHTHASDNVVRIKCSDCTGRRKALCVSQMFSEWLCTENDLQ